MNIRKKNSSVLNLMSKVIKADEKDTDLFLLSSCLCPCIRNSFQCGVMSLRRLNYDRKELERRRDDSQLEVKGVC